MPTRTDSQRLDRIKEYYGRVLKSSKDLRTEACCSSDAAPPHVREILSQIHPEVLEKFYGCGSPIPPAIEGCVVVDLGCGTGRDAYVCSRLVGETGRVIGVDMTEEQLTVAKRHLDTQTRSFGFQAPNVAFRQGYMEDLAAVGIADESVDVVISNCVLNLSPEKERVFSEIFRVLKPGGELYFSDVFADRRLPAAWGEDPVLVGECLAGAMYPEDFRRLLERLGIRDHRIVSRRPLEIDDPEIQQRVGSARFESMTIRAFKLESLEDRCEDYGQVAYYEGTIEGYPHTFVLDDHHVFEKGRPVLVCGNTAALLEETRLARHFRIVGDRRTHYGLFPCGPATLASNGSGDQPGSGGCC